MKDMSNKIMQKEIANEYTTTLVTEDFVEVFDDFMELRQVYSAGIKEIRTKLEILDDEFQVKFDHNPIHHMEYRLKSPKSIIGKLNKRGLPLEISSIKNHLTDIAGVRVICNYVDDIYRIAELLSSQDDITVLKEKDYIAHPKENGYRSLHLVVEIPIFLAERKQPIPVEIQIRTIAMDFWASLEHHLKYKSENQVPDNIRNELLECADTITALDHKMQAIHNQLGHDKKKTLHQ